MDRYHLRQWRGWAFNAIGFRLIIFLLFGHQKISAQTFDVDKQKIELAKNSNTFYIKTSPISMLQGPILLLAEYRLALEAIQNERISYQISAGYLNKSVFFNRAQSSASFNPKNFTFPGYRLQGELRYYLFKFHGIQDAQMKFTPSGYYLAANVSYLNAVLQLKNQAYPRNVFSNYSANAIIGLQALVQQSFGIDIYAGIGYKENALYNIDYRLNKTKLNLEAAGYSAYYNSNLKITLGLNVTMGIF